MLTRRTFLIAAAVSPLAQFCRTEPLSISGHRMIFAKVPGIDRCVQFLSNPPMDDRLVVAISEWMVAAVEFDNRYALPPETLGWLRPPESD